METQPAGRCPKCLQETTAAAERMKPGGYTVCAGCGSAVVFRRDMTLRLMTQQEITELSPAEFREIDGLQRRIRMRKTL